MDTTKKYKRVNPEGLKAGGVYHKEAHVAWNKAQGKWRVFDDSTGEMLGLPAAAGWPLMQPLEFVTAGKWIEYNPTEKGTTMNPIFGYKASDELTGDSWKMLVVATKDIPLETLGDTFKAWEDEYKKETEQPLPGAWRSAKSVIKGAKKAGVELTLGGDARGKTAVEKDIKAGKASPVISVEDEIVRRLNAVVKYANDNGYTLALGTYIIDRFPA